MSLSNWIIGRISKFLSKERPKHPSYLCDFSRISHEVRPADVLLIAGTSRISKVIRRVTNSPWTHACLYIGRLHDIEDPQIREHVHKHYHGKLNDQLLIESMIGKGTIITPLSEYQNEHIRICRPAGLSYIDAQRVVAQASKSLGKRYSLRHIFDIGRFLLMSRFLPGRWRSSLFNYRPGKATEDICSAMIADAFTFIRFPVLPVVRETKDKQLEMIRRNPRLSTPSDFDYSPYFDIIKYPIFSMRNIAPYRDLPWNEELISHDIELVQQPKDQKTKRS